MSKSILEILKSFLGIPIHTSNPIQWEIKAFKTSYNNYKIHLIAFIPYPYKLYAQDSNPLGPYPTTIKFEKKSSVTLIGNIQEVGTKKEIYEELYKVKTQFYNTAVIFVQELKLNTTQSEVLKGSVTYVVCSEKKCSKPITLEFQLELNR